MMPPSFSSGRGNTSDLLVRQVMAAMIQDHPFPAPSPRFPGWCLDTIVDVLSSVPRYFFLSSRSVGRQATSRHRSPLRQRQLHLESRNSRMGQRAGGPAAYRNYRRVRLGVDKALEFYSWVETHCGFVHGESTCREMGRVLAKANFLGRLWAFLRENEGIVRTETVTAIIQVLGEEGLAKEALAAFYRMKQLRCKPDVRAYNVMIAALCRVGDMKKARFLLEQMELPGFRCPPDTYTYTILISAYCRRGMQTGSRKAIRRRIWEANHMFRHMLFKGFVPDVVTYNCLIDGLCKTYRIGRAHELFEDMIQRDCLPNRITYNSFIRYYCKVNDVDKAIEMLRDMVSRKHGLPTCSSYTPIIHALCECGRTKEAREFLLEMVDGRSIPREYTYKLVSDMLIKAGEDDLPHELRSRIEDRIDFRYKQTLLVKPIMKEIARP